MFTSTEDKKFKLLIVDDDEVDRMALNRALSGTTLKPTVSEATDVDEALTAVRAGEYDCIFLDYNLPGGNGLELTKHIRNQGIRVPIIVLTGQGDEQTAVALMKAGASDYLPKSKLSAEAVARLIRGAMRVYQAEQIAEFANRNLREKNQLLEAKNYELERQRLYIYQQNLKLQEVSRLKSEFLATMSHELRTPLNAIIGFSQILASKSRSSLSDRQQDMVSRVLSNGRNLLELINDILAFSKLEAGRLDLNPEELNISQLVSKTVEELQSLATQKQIELVLDIHLDNATVVNDPTRLRQILVNLLSNAIKFTSQGSVRVQLEDTPDTILLSVIDTGCGISETDRQDIFEPFHQADRKISRKHGGTGLGLAITHSLAKMMNGEISLQSTENKGSTFTVKIPRVVIPQTGAVTTEAITPPSQTEAHTELEQTDC